MSPFANSYITPADTTEHVIFAGKCILYGIYPRLTTTGTVTIRNTATAAGGTTWQTCALGLEQTGKSFGPKGVIFDVGLTVQLSAATDLCIIVWEPM